MVLNMLDRYAARFETRLLFLMFYTCPLSWFIFHNQHYGFHVETLLIPLCLLFVSSYLQKSKWYLLWTALIILVKEDAVIILWSCLMAIHVKDWMLKQLTVKQFFQKTLPVTLLCLLILIAGMVWIKYMNNWEKTRSGDILKIIQAKSFSDVGNSFRYLILQRIQLTLFVIFILYLYAGWKYTVAAILLSVPILTVNLLAGVIYSGDGAAGMKNFFSLMWAPRLSMYWAYWLSVTVIALTYKPAFIAAPFRLPRLLGAVCFGLLLFSFQISFFLHCEVMRFDTVRSLAESFEKPLFEEYPNSVLNDAVAIARQLPPHYPVAPMDQVFGAFHKQDIVWLHTIGNCYYKPRMILASYNEKEVPDVAEVMVHPMFMLYKEELHIYCEAEDTSYISKAGIRGTWIDKVRK